MLNARTEWKHLHCLERWMCKISDLDTQWSICIVRLRRNCTLKRVLVGGRPRKFSHNQIWTHLHCLGCCCHQVHYYTADWNSHPPSAQTPERHNQTPHWKSPGTPAFLMPESAGSTVWCWPRSSSSFSSCIVGQLGTFLFGFSFSFSLHLIPFKTFLKFHRKKNVMLKKSHSSPWVPNRNKCQREFSLLAQMKESYRAENYSLLFV